MVRIIHGIPMRSGPASVSGNRYPDCNKEQKSKISKSIFYMDVVCNRIHQRVFFEVECINQDEKNICTYIRPFDVRYSIESDLRYQKK